jgi:diguanylate cyclase (GGDEF)-like protein
MQSEYRNGEGPEPGDDAPAASRFAQRTEGADQANSDADQTASDADQTASDSDERSSMADQASEDRDQVASDRDQAIADRDRAADPDRSGTTNGAYQASRDDRAAASVERFGTRLERETISRERGRTSTARDRHAAARDTESRARDSRADEGEPVLTEPEAALIRELHELRAQSAADRERAAADRARAAIDRATAARERDRLEAELRSAHLDQLTGAYRREMGQLALSHEIDRARRSDGKFVVAFVDIDLLKIVNDRDGHAAGDRVLQTVVREIRSRLRSFDPIIRYGGDEFVCGLSGADLQDAARRFHSIEAAIQADAGIGISVGMAALEAGETPEELIERADVAMLKVKARHHALQT